MCLVRSVLVSQLDQENVVILLIDFLFPGGTIEFLLM